MAALTNLGSSLGPVTGSITVNFALTDPTQPVSPTLYDLQSIVQHEMDEILGIGGPGSTLGAGVPDDTTPPPTTVGPLDFFRYHAPFVRSFTYSTDTTSYFSITDGLLPLVAFNQQFGFGTDYADWGSSVPMVQDADATPGTMPNLGRNEVIAFEVVGYNLTPAGQRLLLSQADQPFARALPAGKLPHNAKTL